MDIFSAEELFSKLEMAETQPYTAKLEEVGFETMNFLINSGSFFVFLLLGVLEYFGRKVLVFICTRFARYKFFRRVGLLVDKPTLGATLIRLAMQTYIDILICSLLQMIQF